MNGYIIASIIGSVIWGIVWGVITKKVIENKGYSENWFWWGFFFGFIALIVALTKPDINNRYSRPNVYGSPQGIDNSSALGRLASADSWKCPVCGTLNPGYQTTCGCGTNKSEISSIRREQAVEREMLNEQKKESQNLDMLKKYKDLLDSGVISREEFEEKKKQLLNL